jgi:hypothetical protein
MFSYTGLKIEEKKYQMVEKSPDDESEQTQS